MASVFRHHYVRLAVAGVKICFLNHLFVTHVFDVKPADGPSMLPTFSTYGDCVGIDARYRLGRGIGVGDLVIYKIPFKKYEMGVKRVIGMPGDYVSTGTPGSQGEAQMIQVSLAFIRLSSEHRSDFFQVPPGHCWITGDNLVMSRDSRTFGPVPLALVQGKVVSKVLPWHEREWIKNGLEPVEG